MGIHIPRVIDYLEDFAQALAEQLVLRDEPRWKHEWLRRPREGQEDRIEQDFARYFRDYHTIGTPVPWLKVAGNAMIAWIRENYPDDWARGNKEVARQNSK